MATFVDSSFFTVSLSWQTLYTQNIPTWLFPNSLVWLQSLHPMNCACPKSCVLWRNLQLMGLNQEPRLLTQETLWQTFITNVLKQRGNARTSIENDNCLSCLLRKQTLKKKAYNCIMSLNDWWLQLNKDSWICVFNSSMGTRKNRYFISWPHWQVIPNTSAQNTAMISSHA